ARRAIELDDTLPEAHTTSGMAFFFFHHDWARAEQAFLRALAIDPRHAPAHTFYALLLAALGRLDEAAASAARGRDLDPLSPVMQMGMAWIAYFSGRFHDAIELTRELLAVAPDFAEANAILLLSYERNGQLERALDSFGSAAGCFRLPDAAGAERLRQALVKDGPRGYWRERLALALEMAETSYVSPLSVASLYVATGDRDRAFEALDRVVEERGGTAVFMGVEPALNPLKDDPRFDALLRRLGLPAAVTAP
ncbi:MAG TPA: tetratricopeptide repeat protein, partial [Methylomirabilota bacterium]